MVEVPFRFVAVNLYWAFEISVHIKSSTKKVNFVDVEQGPVQFIVSLTTKPPPESTKRVKLMSPAPSTGLLTFTLKVQFVPQPSVASDCCPLTVSFARTGVPEATASWVTSN